MKKRNIWKLLLVVTAGILIFNYLHNAERYFKKGHAEQGRGRLDEAMMNFNRAIELDPHYAAAYVERGHVCMRKTEWAAAVSNYSTACALAPNLSNVFVFAADAQSSAGDMAGAISNFNKAIELDPRNAQNYAKRGFAIMDGTNFDAYIADLERAVKLDKSFSFELERAYDMRGGIRSSSGDTAGAKADVERAMQGNASSRANAYILSAELKEQAGDLHGAIADLEASLKLKPQAHVYYSCAQLRFSIDDLDGAMADCDRSIELSSHVDFAHNLRGLLKRMKGDLDGAIADYSKAIELAPEGPPLAHIRRGFAYQLKYDLVAALSDFNQAIDAYRRVSAKSARQAMEMNHDDIITKTYAGRGVVFIQVENYGAAVDDLRHALEMSPAAQASDHLLIWVGRVMLGEKEQADQEMREFVAGRLKSRPSAWSVKIARFLIDQTSQPELLAAAATSGIITAVDKGDAKQQAWQRAQAWYYIGVKKRMAGDKAGERESFENAVATASKSCPEYHCSKSALANPKHW